MRDFCDFVRLRNISAGHHTIWYVNTGGSASSAKVILTNTAWSEVL